MGQLCHLGTAEAEGSEDKSADHSSPNFRSRILGIVFHAKRLTADSRTLVFVGKSVTLADLVRSIRL